MHYILPLPLHIGSTILFSLITLLGLVGGELVKKIRFLPRVFGYIAIGFLIGPGAFNLVEPSILEQSHLFIDISLGLILFEIGRYLDFSWLRHDRYLLPMSVTESSMTFIFLFATLLILKLPWLPAALVATIAVATSPAVLMMVSHDLNTHGPVTRRALTLTSLNNLFALIVFTILLPFANLHTVPLTQIFIHIAYHLFGAVILALIMFAITLLLSRLTGKSTERQFVLFVGMTVLAIGLARMLHLSTMLTLFLFGVIARNFDWRHRLAPIDFGAVARFFLIILFVLTGVYLQPRGIWQEAMAVIAFIVVRFAAKLSGVFLFAKASRLTGQQAWSTSIALMPMAGVALGMSFMLINLNPELGASLVIIVSAALAILNLIGPILAQWAFLKAGEAESNDITSRTSA